MPKSSNLIDNSSFQITHWQHPRFHAYFPAGNSYPSILGDMLSDAIGCIGFSWVSRKKNMRVLNWIDVEGIKATNSFKACQLNLQYSRPSNIGQPSQSWSHRLLNFLTNHLILFAPFPTLCFFFDCHLLMENKYFSHLVLWSFFLYITFFQYCYFRWIIIYQ